MNLLDQIRIVLVEPSHPGNVGGVARAMKNMGLKQLVLVNPARFPNPQAEWRAANAVDVLDAAQVVTGLDAAIGDCRLVVGTSTRSRRIPWPVVSPAQLARQLWAPDSAAGTEPAPVAILFGRETSGLSNEELQRCNKHLQIPAHADYPSLNLAMAVQVVCYELFRHSVEGADPDGGETGHWDRRWATASELEGLLQHLDQVLQEIDFYGADSRRQSLTRFRRLYTRVGLDETEVQMLRGMLTQIRTAIGGGH